MLTVGRSDDEMMETIKSSTGSVQFEWNEHEEMTQDKYILEVKNLKQHFPIYKGFFQRVVGYTKAVDGVSFSLVEKEVLGVVGESGCGKTTTGRSILRLYEPTDGEIWYRREDGSRINVVDLNKRDMKKLRREMRMIFQDPFSSLNPRLTVKDLIGEPLVIQKEARGKELEERVAKLMRSVGLDPNYMSRYPHEFSGGQRQRIGLARTLALSPRLIIADEPVSALDVSVQAQVLNLLQELKEELGLTLIFIAHDLSVVEHVSDRIAVMYVGKIVELAESEELLRHPMHPYTEALVSAVPPADPDIHLERIILEGDVPSPANPPSRVRVPSPLPICQGYMSCIKEGGQRILDIGTGSGVLAIAALKLGLEMGLGLDIDPCARVEASENAELNGLSQRMDISGCSLDTLQGVFFLITANLRFPTLKAYLKNMIDLTETGSFLVISGIKINEISKWKICPRELG